MPTATGSIAQGVLGNLVDYMHQERERNRQREDAELAWKINVIQNEVNKPNFKPEFLGRAFHEMADLHSAQMGNRPMKSGTAGALGETQLPMTQLFDALAKQDPDLQSTPTPSGTTEVKAAGTGAQSIGQPGAAQPPASAVGPIPSMASTPAPQAAPQGAAPSLSMGQVEQGPQQPIGTGINIPPEGVDNTPTGSRVIDAGRDLAKYGQPAAVPVGMPPSQPVARPPNYPPWLRTPDEMAQQAGRTQGTLEMAKRRADIQAREMEVASMRQQGMNIDDKTAAAYIMGMPATMMKPSYKVDENGILHSVTPMGGAEPVMDETGQPFKAHVSSAGNKINQLVQAAMASGRFTDEAEARKWAATQQMDAMTAAIADKKLGSQLKQRMLSGPIDWKTAVEISSRAASSSGKLYTPEDVLAIAAQYQQGGAAPTVAPPTVPAPPTTPGAPPTVPAPPTTGAKPTAGAGAAPQYLLGPQKLTQQTQQVIGGINILRQEAQRIMKTIEDSKVLDDPRRANNPIPMKVAQAAYGIGFDPDKLGIAPYEVSTELLQQTGVAEAYGLRGLIAGRPNIKLIEIFEKHLPQGGDSPALMYKKLKEITKPGGIADTVESSVRQAGQPERLGREGQTPTTSSAQPPAAPKTATEDHINQFAKEKGITPDKARKLFTDKGYTITKQ